MPHYMLLDEKCNDILTLVYVLVLFVEVGDRLAQSDLEHVLAGRRTPASVSGRCSVPSAAPQEAASCADSAPSRRTTQQPARHMADRTANDATGRPMAAVPESDRSRAAAPPALPPLPRPRPPGKRARDDEPPAVSRDDRPRAVRGSAPTRSASGEEYLVSSKKQKVGTRVRDQFFEKLAVPGTRRLTGARHRHPQSPPPRTPRRQQTGPTPAVRRTTARRQCRPCATRRRCRPPCPRVRRRRSSAAGSGTDLRCTRD